MVTRSKQPVNDTFMCWTLYLLEEAFYCQVVGRQEYVTDIHLSDSICANFCLSLIHNSPYSCHGFIQVDFLLQCNVLMNTQPHTVFICVSADRDRETFPSFHFLFVWSTYQSHLFKTKTELTSFCTAVPDKIFTKNQINVTSRHCSTVG